MQAARHTVYRVAAPGFDWRRDLSSFAYILVLCRAGFDVMAA